MLKNGNKRGPGGAQPGSGRPPAWLRAQCLAAVKKHKLVQRLTKIASGELMDFKLDHNTGKVVQVPVSIHDQKDAQQYLIDRIGGKAAQSMDLTSGGGPVTVRVTNYADMAPKENPDNVKKEPKA